MMINLQTKQEVYWLLFIIKTHAITIYSFTTDKSRTKLLAEKISYLKVRDS